MSAAALYNLAGGATLTNCVFRGNVADNTGGGIYTRGIRESKSLSLTNCTFADNSATYGRALAFDSTDQDYPSNVNIMNSILWEEGSEIWNNDSSTIIIGYTDIYGGWPGDGNINAEPHFVDPDGLDDIPGTVDDNLRLSRVSPCIDAGDNTAVPPDSSDVDGDSDTIERTPRDLGGNLRFVDDCGTGDTGVPDPPNYKAVVDMGAYEYQPNDIDVDGTVGLLDYAGFLGCASGPAGGSLDPECESMDSDCDGDIDLHDFSRFQAAFAGQQ